MRWKPCAAGLLGGVRPVTPGAALVATLLVEIALSATARQNAVVNDGLAQIARSEGAYLAKLEGAYRPGPVE